MLDIKFIRDNKNRVQEAITNKQINLDLDKLLTKDDKRRELQTEIDSLRSEQKEAGQDRDFEKAKLLKEKITDLDKQYQIVLSEYNELMYHVPQIIHADVPVWISDQDNVEERRQGEIPKFDFDYQDHVTLMEKNDMIDIERGVKLAWTRSYILKWDGALLEQAVLQYAYKKLLQKWFTPMQIPYLVDRKAFVGTWFFPGGEDDAYHVEQDDKWLIATAEIPLTSYYADEILKESDLPQAFFWLTPCFRREAGTYWKDTHGLYRVHQFNKVEQVVILPANEVLAEEWYYRILHNAEEILQDLEIPYRVLQICTWDLSIGKYISHDIESRMPSRESYSETHSVSSLLDFQSRRLNIRYRDAEWNLHHCYTMNNTAIALPRFLIALIENYQNKDWSIRVPKVLQDYMGKSIIKNF